MEEPKAADPVAEEPQDNPTQDVESIVEPQATIPGETASETPDWKDDLPESLKASKRLAKFKSKAELAQSYEELEGKLGRSVEIPGKDAKPEEWDKFLTRLGRPKSADEYVLESVDGFTATDSYLSELKGIFHSAGLTAAQANIIHKELAARAAMVEEQERNSKEDEREKREESVRAKREAAENTLRNAWGLNYDIRLEHARRFVIAEGGEEALAHLDSIGVGSDPVVLKLLSQAGAATGSHRLVTGLAAKGQHPGPYEYMNRGIGKD